MQIEKITKNEETLDHNLYSRQIGAYGVDMMTKLVKMEVLIIGLSGVGIETAKNLILSGPKSVTIWDNRVVNQTDQEYNYYLTQQQILGNQRRDDCLISHFKELNSYVSVEIAPQNSIDQFLDKNIYENINVVVVTDFYPLNFLYQLNDLLRSLNKGLIISATSGLLGFVFTDFGFNHIIIDKNGEPKKTVLITTIDSNGIITTEENKRHDLEEGDLVKFHEVVGMENLNGQTFEIKKVISPFSFQIQDISEYGSYERNGYIEEEKKKINMKFKTLKEVLEHPQPDLMDCDMDFNNLDKVQILKVLLRVLWKEFSDNGYWDFFNNEEVFIEKFKNELIHEIELVEFEINKNNNGEKISKQEWLNVLKTNLAGLVYGFAPGNFIPVASFFGGIAAQEVVKYTGKFTPINHIFIHEFYSSLFKDKNLNDFKENIESVQKHKNSRYVSHYALFGEQLFESFKNSKILLVGAGALGCEYLKMFALMGLSCGSKGEFKVVDDDQIEVSNLNRQFLFRAKHVGSPKAQTSSEVVKQFNSEFKVVPVQGRLQTSTEYIFTDVYWDSLDFIINAVDNIKARKYVDKKAVLHKKALFESGTLGTKCNSQLILPDLTECYRDSRDPKQKSIPECTMRNFPYLMDHCIEWSRAKFFDTFVTPSNILAEFSKDAEKAILKMKKDLQTKLPEFIKLVDHLQYFINILKRPVLEEYFKFALWLYQEFFDTKINELLFLFPPDYVDKEGKLFWTSPKRPPIVTPFDKNNLDHQNFILTSIKILNQIIPLQEDCDDEKVLNYLKEFKITRKKLNVKANRDDLTNEEQQQKPQVNSQDEEKIQNIFQEFHDILSKSKLKIQEVEFEKDDDNNGHIDFITFYSNFRATNYSIQVAQRHDIKMKAGRIIPAIATTTAMVCGAIGIEVYKYVLKQNILNMRNFFSTLAVPIFAFSEPSPPLVQKDKDYDVIVMGPIKTIPKNWNTWSRIDVEGDKTLQEVINDVKQRLNFTISSVICSRQQLYINFIEATHYRLKKKVEESLEEVGLKRYPGKLYECLSVAGEDDDGNDILCPEIVYHFK